MCGFGGKGKSKGKSKSKGKGKSKSKSKGKTQRNAEATQGQGECGGRYSTPLRVRMTGRKEDATAFVAGDLVPDDLGGRAGVGGKADGGKYFWQRRSEIDWHDFFFGGWMGAKICLPVKVNF